MNEKDEIKRDGGRAQKNSGRGHIQKGDATLGPFCYDIKEYSNSFSVSKDVWGKCCTDAFKSGNMEPALKLVLGDSNPIRVWVVADHIIKDYLRLLETYEN